MYFTTTPEGNRMEALMKKPPGFVQRGGGLIGVGVPLHKAGLRLPLLPVLSSEKLHRFGMSILGNSAGMRCSFFL